MRHFVWVVLFAATTAAWSYAPGLDSVFTEYGKLQSALAGDDFDAARKAADALKSAAEHVKADDLADGEKKIWKNAGMKLAKSAGAVGASADIKAARATFEDISKAMIMLAEVAHPDGYARFRCPMAFNNKGADWLQQGDTVNNPYFGSAMLRCGYKVKPKNDHGHGHDHDHDHNHKH